MLTSTYSNGVVTSRSYNDDNTLSLIDFGGTSGGNIMGDLSYTWDSNKNKTSELIAGAMSGYSFTVPTSGYDAEDRLVSFGGAANQPDQSWNLSLVGDWDSVTTDGTTQNRTHGPTHELLTADGQNVVQDAKGNMTTIPANLRSSDTALNLTWDFDNRMSGADIDGDGTTDVTYQFDALGRRVGRIHGNDRRVYPQVGQQTVADYQPGAAASRPASRYLWGSYIDEPIVRLNPNGARVFYHQNQQYSTYALTNASGQIIERYTYTAYGEQKVLAPSTSARTKSTYGIRHTYTGREWDSALGLYHFRARMYDPISGRFCSRDPIGYEGSKWSLYEFLGSSPIARTDPSGKKYASCCVAIACLARQDAACMLACAYDPVWDDRRDTWSDCYFKCRRAVLVGKLKGLSDAACLAAAYACGGRVLNEYAKYMGPNKLPKPVMPQGPQGPAGGL